MNKELLNKAVEKGIVNHKQASDLFDFFSMEESRLDRQEVVNNSGEQLKFLRSFGDVFIALGVLLLAFTCSQLALNTTYQIITIVAFFLMAEWLVGHKRLVLPGITILLSILYFVNLVVDMILEDKAIGVIGESLDVFLIVMVSLLFYLRYKMPFSLYPFAVSCILLFIQLSGINIIESPYVFIILGLAVFMAAMWYDSRDTQRLSSLSDNGFWLHLLAAPLMVHGVMVSLFFAQQSDWQATSLSLFSLISLFFFIALFVDRRAMLVSSFAYALYAVFKFAYDRFMQVDNLTLFIFMAIALFIIFFGTYWYRVRTWVFSPIASLKVCRLVPAFNNK